MIDIQEIKNRAFDEAVQELKEELEGDLTALKKIEAIERNALLQK